VLCLYITIPSFGLSQSMLRNELLTDVRQGLHWRTLLGLFIRSFCTSYSSDWVLDFCMKAETDYIMSDGVRRPLNHVQEQACCACAQPNLCESVSTRTSTYCHLVQGGNSGCAASLQH
jgi:hypothetical protein